MSDNIGIDVMLNNVTLEKAILKLYPELEFKYFKPILNSIVFTRKYLRIDEAKKLFNEHIPKISKLINWKLFYEYCLIDDYMRRYQEETGLQGNKLLEHMGGEALSWTDVNELAGYLKLSKHQMFVDMFKEIFNSDMIKSFDTFGNHVKHTEREKKLIRILSFVDEVED